MALCYQESGWLFQSGTMQNIIRDVSESDLMDLFAFADEEDNWTRRVRDEVEQEEKSHKVENFLVSTIRLLNTAGTGVALPYGDVITFPARRHLFRGENKAHEKSVPTLNRRIISNPRTAPELHRVIENMRIEQFCKFLWRLNIIPYWEAKLSDINYKALAQHYGFCTHLFDLTNDFRCALFFATCKYDVERDCYHPLTQRDIEADEKSGYGVVFHSPDWMIDFFQPEACRSLYMRFMKSSATNEQVQIDDEMMEGAAFQIGFQPLMRCHSQSGYVFPVRSNSFLQQDNRFEKLKFRQSVRLSERIFELMDGGKKVFPHEGISRARKYIRQMQKSLTFSEDDMKAAYEHWHINKTMFPTIEDLKEALLAVQFEDQTIRIMSEEIDYHIPEDTIASINKAYDDIDLGAMIGGMIHMTPDYEERRNRRCRLLYGKLI